MSTKWLLYYWPRLKWYLFVWLHWTSVWRTLYWLARKSWIAKFSILSVAGKTQLWTPKCYSSHCIYTILHSHSINLCWLEKKKKHISEIKVYQQSHGNKKWTTKSRKSLERSTDEDSVLGTFFYSVAPFHTARTPPALRVLSGDDLAAHVRSVGAQHSSVAAG